MVDPVCLAKAGAALARKDWAAAAEAFRQAGPASELTLPDGLRRNLAMNFADLSRYRPEVMRTLDMMAPDGRFQIATTPAGQPTICFNGKPLSGAQDPLLALNGVLKQLEPSRKAGKTLGLFGTGDGYLLVALARHPIKLPLGREEAIHYFEPHAANLLAAMMIHDLSGETGAIRQRRFGWYVGEDCAEQFRRAYLAEPGIGYPEIEIAAEPAGKTIPPQMAAALREMIEVDRVLAEKVSALCSEVTIERLVDATSRTPSRRPRALLLTTRFSTVLQYSTADLADGLRQLGWETDVVMEDEPHHALTLPGLRKRLLALDPDVVFQLDHLRSEHGGLIPAAVPFVCWAQDHLPNLCNRAAGKSMRAMDFFMTSLGDWFVREYDYPQASIVETPKFTKIPEIPDEWENDGPDLTYVSNASQLPESAAGEYAKRFEGVAHDIAVAAARAVIAAYEGGQTFYGPNDLQPIVTAAAATHGVRAEQLPHELTVDLFERVNNLCYRQQALAWVAEAADEMNLSLAIYGAGWEGHPRFAKYARGHVQYGPELERLTRASKINLQIVPYFCLHQRLLDGIAAGGFFLVRSHPSDLALPALCDFVERHVPADVRTYAEARLRLSPEVLRRLDEHALANAHIADMLDVVQQARNAKAMGLFPENAPMPERIGEVSFASAADCAAKIRRFLARPELRREIAREQRESTAGVLSYAAGLRRVLDSIHSKLLAIRDATPSLEIAA